MSLDFTLSKYEELCRALLNSGYLTLRFDAYLRLKTKPEKFVILRHDVDLAPSKALCMAKLEYKLNIASSYYFRYPQTFSKHVIRGIYDLGHEIGYHYEVLARAKGDCRKALVYFNRALCNFREIVQVSTISAHGSILSKWDNRKLWEKANFRDFGIMGETYLSVDYDDILYVTDTGRGWNKHGANVRDKVTTTFRYRFRTTSDFVAATSNNRLPRKIMINVHPPRWSNNLVYWSKELIDQSVKNIFKEFILKGVHD